jgi:hypothetical protein
LGGFRPPRRRRPSRDRSQPLKLARRLTVLRFACVADATLVREAKERLPTPRTSPRWAVEPGTLLGSALFQPACTQMKAVEPASPAPRCHLFGASVPFPGARETPRPPPDPEAFEARAAVAPRLYARGGSSLPPFLRLGDHGGQGAGRFFGGRRWVVELFAVGAQGRNRTPDGRLYAPLDGKIHRSLAWAEAALG